MFYNQPFLVNPNPICRSFRDATHAEWVKSLKGALADLHAYVKAHHTTGLVWSKTVSNKTVLKVVLNSLNIPLLTFNHSYTTKSRKNF